MRTAWVIANRTAGGGRCGQRLDRVWPKIEEGLHCVVHETTGPGDATDIAERARAQGVTDVIAVGGDGTLFEVVNGLMKGSGPMPRLGILPFGTGNSFSRDLHHETPEGFVSAILGEQTRSVDVVRAEHDDGELYSINLFSIGFTAVAGELTNARFKGLGVAGYIVAVLLTLVRLRHPTFRIRRDEGAWETEPCALLSFSNSRYTGGDMCMAPFADPSDGRVDCIRVGAMGRLRFLATFPKIFAGTHVDGTFVTASTAQTVAFDLEEPVAVMVDGEIRTLKVRELRVVPAALEVLA
jgi:YegS/Rv2252/BmrU family lipid kinase